MNSILITGGAGYFGRNFVKRLLDECLYDRIVIYSRGEHRQAQMRDELNHDNRLRFIIGDVRDLDRLERAMLGCDVVISAAALKRIEVGAYSPDEMCRTNVIGALNVVEAARRAKVGKVVHLSTDKAWAAASPYGQSKALAEHIFLSANGMFGEHGPRYSVLRYGNIWKADGSVVPRWEAMKKAGVTTVPVTDPDCTRFFMLINEASDLVLKTIEMMPKEVVIPETLPAYRVGDLVEAMGLNMEVLGLPWWEKKHEGMREGLTSDLARRMSVAELEAALCQN